MRHRHALQVKIEAAQNLSHRRHKIPGRPSTALQTLARKTLESHAVFRQAGAATCEALLAASTVQRFADGETIVTRGQAMASLILLLDGSIELGMLGPSGKRFVRWYLGPGQAQGFIPVLDGKGAIYDARSHGAAVALLIPRVPLRTAIAADPRLALAVLDGMCERSRAMHESAASDALLPLRGRVARMILQLAASWGLQRDDGVLVSLKLSQDEFAALLAVTRQALNRELKALEAEGAISIAYSKITVLDQSILADAAETPVKPPGFA